MYSNEKNVLAKTVGCCVLIYQKKLFIATLYAYLTNGVIRLFIKSQILRVRIPLCTATGNVQFNNGFTFVQGL